MQEPEELIRTLERIDGRGYKAYRDIEASFAFERFDLHVDRVQGDPFAAPSKLRIRVASEMARFPSALFSTRTRKIALADFVAREVRRAITSQRGSRTDPREEIQESRGQRGEASRSERHRRGRGRNSERESARGSGKSGLVFIDAGGQEVLERTAVRITPDFVEARIEVGLPAAGRRVLGRQAQELLCRQLPRIVESALLFESLDPERARHFVECIENQEHIRSRLAEEGLIAFVGDGSILPRESGASERPMPAADALPFSSPPSHRVTFELPNPIHEGDGDGETRCISGMGIREGVTLIVGGGYHGKSTLLRALECGVYPHVPGDGREWVVSSADLVKIRAEDGRAVTGVDIHGFIGELPQPQQQGASRKDPLCFTSDDASGSTSQAANIVEAIEVGARGLLLDEDTSATNFMLRDARMQKLVHKDYEPITPFVDRVRELHDAFGVSTILVMGGCGDYFESADSVIMMRDFAPQDVTQEAKRIAAENDAGRSIERPGPMREVTQRIPLARSLVARRGRKDVSISAKSRELILYGERALDLRYVTQLLDISQTRAVAMAMHLASERFMGNESPGLERKQSTLSTVLGEIESFLEEEGLDALDLYRRDSRDGRHPGSFARPRRYEIAAAMNRMRGLSLIAASSGIGPRTSS